MATSPLQLTACAAALASAALAALPAASSASLTLVEGRACPLRVTTPVVDRRLVVPILMYHRINTVTPSTPRWSGGSPCTRPTSHVK